jgi:hypothetical protein
MRRAIVLLGVILLGGCLPDQAKDVEACRAEALRFYQMPPHVDPTDPGSRYIIGCMAAKGYDFSVLPADCDSRHPLSTQPACYTANGWLAGIVDQFYRPTKSN